MSKKTRYLLGILLTIVIGMIFMWFMCCQTDTKNIPEDIQNNREDVIPAVVTDKGFTFKDSDPDGSFAYTSNDNFNFNVSDYSILTPASQGVNKGIHQLQAYLKDHPKKSIDITGRYAPSEKNSSAFPNLGIARANAIKNYVSTNGVASSQINIFGEEDSTLVLDNTLYKDAIRYKIRENINNEAQELEALKKRINDDPLILNFKNGQASINLTTEQRQKIADLSRYLDKIEGSSITIEGHTDNSGGRITNTTLGKKRAGYLKEYFVRNGVSDEKIITSSKGPDQPIASNETEEGKAKNRRSVVTIN
jgi:OOP family OmpA-OmpF porin